MNSKFYSLFIALLFLIFVVLSNITLPGNAYLGAGSFETGYIEAFQAIILVSILIVGFIRKRYLVYAYSRSTYWLRQSLFSLLFFEEISYLTASKLHFSHFNSQSELNLHNSNFITHSFASFDFFGDRSIDLTPYLLINIFFTIFLFSGGRIPFLKRFNIIYLHPFVRIGIMFFMFSSYGLLSITFSHLNGNLFFLGDNFSIINAELSELFIYIIFLMDIVIKSYPHLNANSCK